MANTMFAKIKHDLKKKLITQGVDNEDCTPYRYFFLHLQQIESSSISNAKHPLGDTFPHS